MLTKEEIEEHVSTLKGSDNSVANQAIAALLVHVAECLGIIASPPEFGHSQQTAQAIADSVNEARVGPGAPRV